jgi:hypothetical protein
MTWRRGVAAASDEDDDRSSFDCDREALNAWFHRHQGNRVKKSCGNETCEEIVVP